MIRVTIWDMDKKILAPLVIAALSIAGSVTACNWQDLRSKDPEEAVEMSLEVAKCTAVVGSQLEAANKKVPMAAVVAFCAAVVASPEIEPVPVSPMEGAKMPAL